MLDPLTAISLTAAVVQLADFTTNIVRRIEDLRQRSGNPPRCLHNVHAQLALIKSLLPQTKNRLEAGTCSDDMQQAVQEIVRECHTQVERLSLIIEKVISRSGDSRWTVSKKVWWSLRNERRVREIDTVLQRYVQSLTYYETVTTPRSIEHPPASVSAAKFVENFDVPFPRDKDFIGREDILRNLSQTLRLKSQIALVGVGGVGKSQVAIEACYRFHEQQPIASVFWINASNSDRFKHGYKRIARRLALPGWNGYAVDPLELVKDWLEANANVEWLLVLDGLDDMESIFPSEASSRGSREYIHQYLPKASTGRMLLTSRDRRVGSRLFGHKSTIKLAEPAMTEAQALLNRKLTKSCVIRQTSECLIKELCFLPLAITQAAAYINESNIDVLTYLELLRAEERPAEVLDQELGDIRRTYDDDSSSSVFRTFQISFDGLISRNKEAADLLALIGTLEGCAVPCSLLHGSSKFASPTHLTAVTVLESLSLIEFQKNREFLSMHGLVHRCVRRWIQLNKTADYWHCEASSRIFKSFPRFNAFDRVEKGMDQWAVCETLLPHALLLLRTRPHAARKSELQKKLHILVVKYKGQRNWRDPITDEIRLIYTYFDEQNLEWHLRASDELVLLRREQGRYAEAVQILESLLRLLIAARSEHTSLALQVQLELSFCLYQLGNVARASQVVNDTREASSRLSDDEDSFRQHRCNEILGMIKGTTASFDDAIQLFESVVKWTLAKLGEKHRMTLNSRRNLFITLTKAGNPEDAEREGEALLAAIDEVEGSAHLRSLWIRCILAETYLFLGKAQEAERLALDVLVKPSEAVKSPLRDSTLAILMRSYWLQGRILETMCIEEELLASAAAVIGDEIGNITALNRLAYFGRYLHRRGRGRTSKSLLEAVLKAQEQAAAEEIDLKKTKQFLDEVEVCSCRAVDVSFGLWQPSCPWRKVVFEGVINWPRDHHKPACPYVLGPALWQSSREAC